MSTDYSVQKNAQLDADGLKRLFVQVDWAHSREVKDIAVMLAATTFHITAWKTNELVGFMRVLTDWKYRGFIEDVIVDGQHRDKGIGTQMLALALEELRNVEELVLGCIEENVAYYEKFGFKRVSHPFMKRTA